LFALPAGIYFVRELLFYNYYFLLFLDMNCIIVTMLYWHAL